MTPLESESRPWKILQLGKSAEPLVGGLGQWRTANPDGVNEDLRINPDLSPLYEENLRWIEMAALTVICVGR